MTKYIHYFFFIFILALGMGWAGLYSQLATAASPTPSPSASPKTVVSSSPTATPSAQTTQNLKDRIEKVVQERREQIKGTLDALGQRKRGFIGQIQRVSENSITVKTAKSSEIISIDDSITLLKAGKKIGMSDLAVENWVIVMGYADGDDFTAKRILVSTESLRPLDHVVHLGSIESLTTKVLQLKSRAGDSLSYTVNTKTAYQDSDGSTVTLKSLTPDTQVIVVGYTTSDGKIATIVRAVAPLSDD